MNKILKFIFDEILYNGHLQALGSLSIVIFSSLILKINITWDFLAILYLTFYLILLYDRFRHIEIDYATNKTRSKHIKKFNRHIPYIMLLILLVLFVLLFIYANIKFFIFMIFIVILGLSYPHYFKGITKKIFLFKNFYVSSFFTLLLLFPFFYYSLPIRPVLSYILALVIFAFLRDMRMQFVLDLKDIESDKKEGLLTLGVLYGKEKVLKILKISSFITTCLVPLLIFLLLDFTPAILMLGFLIVFDFYLIFLIKKENFKAYILESGEFILWPLLIATGTKL